MMEKPKEEVATVAQVKDLFSAAKSLEHQASLARKKRDRVWLEKLREYGRKLAVHFWEILKSSVVIGISTIVMELCQRALLKVTEFVTGFKLPSAAPQPSSNSNYGDPFSRHYGGTQLSW